MTPDDIRRLRELEKDATRGPWTAKNNQVRAKDERGIRVGMWPHIANAHEKAKP